MGANKSVALYRKYRGLSFDDIVGQEHITSVLKNAIEHDRISHAYLLTGPHGVGKTSVARILAHAINGLEYKHEDNHIDIIEIDAASNRRIDEIRDLREKSHVAPVSAKYKVYIIDEVHMLTKEAFNALLKTLEEPPTHVVFVLATTEIHKLPQTIVSRTQRHTFKPIDVNSVVGHLKGIAAKEKISIDDEALELVAKHGKGSFRDAIGLLDQVAGLDENTKTTADDVRRMLGLASGELIGELISSTLTGGYTAIATELKQLTETGIQPELLANQLVDHLKQSDIYYDNLDLAEELIAVPSHNQPSLKLELVLLQHAGRGRTPIPQASQPAKPPVAPPTQTTPRPKTAPVTKRPKNEIQNEPTPPIQEKTPTRAEKSKPDPEQTQEVTPDPSIEPGDADLNLDTWKQIIEIVKTDNNAIAAILRGLPPKINDDKITIFVKFALHKKKVEDAGAQKSLQNAMTKILGKTLEIAVEIASKPEAEAATESKTNTDEIADSIIDTFGGGEKVDI